MSFFIQECGKEIVIRIILVNMEILIYLFFKWKWLVVASKNTAFIAHNVQQNWLVNFQNLLKTMLYVLWNIIQIRMVAEFTLTTQISFRNRPTAFCVYTAVLSICPITPSLLCTDRGGFQSTSDSASCCSLRRRKVEKKKKKLKERKMVNIEVHRQEVGVISSGSHHSHFLYDWTDKEKRVTKRKEVLFSKIKDRSRKSVSCPREIHPFQVCTHTGSVFQLRRSQSIKSVIDR